MIRLTLRAFELVAYLALAVLPAAVFLQPAPTPPAEKTFTLAPDALIYLDGVRCTLADLPEGARLQIQTNAAGQVERLFATSPQAGLKRRLRDGQGKIIKEGIARPQPAPADGGPPCPCAAGGPCRCPAGKCPCPARRPPVPPRP